MPPVYIDRYWVSYYSIAGDVPQAISYLKKAVSEGFKDWDNLNKDPSLDKIKTSKDYLDIVKN
jgi:hypothetical protein